MVSQQDCKQKCKQRFKGSGFNVQGYLTSLILLFATALGDDSFNFNRDIRAFRLVVRV
jgi:hypothetical protein